MRHGRLRAGAMTLMLAWAAGPALAQEPRPRPSLNLYGTTGLIDMPTAQAQPDGQVSASYSRFGETTRRNFTFQILPRVSGTLRYATIRNWGRSGEPDYDLFDRSFDLQLQLLDERGWRPALAVGLRDFLGTGVYSGEYIVATKTVARDFTLTGGIGWGRLAGVGGFENPFCTVVDTLCERDRDFGLGGETSFDTFFRGGDAAFFGGVEWRTPIDRLTLKAEYSSDAYSREQRGPRADFDRAWPVNLGAEYRLRDGVTLGGYYMYGSTLGFNVALSANPKTRLVPDLGPGPVPVVARPAGYNRSGAWVGNEAARGQLVEGIGEVLAADGITLQEVRFAPDVVDVFIVNRRINQTPKAVGRTARVLAVGLPHSVERFRITPIEDGLPTTTVVVDRSALEAQVDRPDAGAASWRSVEIAGAVPALGGTVWRRDIYPGFQWSVLPVPSFQLFGGNDGFRPQLSLQARGTLHLSPQLSFSARVRQPLIGTFDDPDPTRGERVLPPVRRDSERYYSGADPKLMRLTGDYLFKLNRDIYARLSAGLLERQFGGVSGEVLWKPAAQRWGLGLELNYVKQRDFDDIIGFDFYDYDVATGHASVYWDTGYKGLELQVDAGRYLAGDWGATVSVSRWFANGWSVGAFATKTDVTAEDFGEGSFDKGITLSIPLRWSTPFETRQRITGDLRSLSSDGGSRLDVANRLYPKVREYDRARLERNWGAFWQ